MMYRIFKTAERVYGWLGPAYDDSEKAIETLAGMWSPYRLVDSTPERLNLGELSSHNRREKLPGWTDHVWHSIDKLVDREWFKRAWIVQELVLPGTVYLLCGKSRIDWDCFFGALKICERRLNSRTGPNIDQIKVLSHAGPVYAMGITREALRQSAKKYSLLDLLDIFSHARATIPQDKLFALLAVAFDSTKDDFTPDYDSSMEDVVRRYARAFVSMGRVMDLLYRAGRRKSYEFSTWIPEWTRASFPGTISTWQAEGGSFCAGRRTPPMSKTPTSATLAVSGFSIDAIASVATIRMGNRNILSFLDASADFRRLTQFITSYPTGETRDQILLRLPIGNARRPHLETTMDQEKSYRDFARSAEADWKWPENLRDLMFSLSPAQEESEYFKLPEEDQQIVSRYWQTAAALSNRIGAAVFCVTKEGYVGLAPEGVAVGDEICIPHGSDVPFAIRKQGANYELMGECYIHGIMHGEALRPDLVEVTFQLE